MLRRVPLSFAALAIAFCGSSLASAQVDTDGDGISDVADIFPCDSTASAISYAPAQGTFGLVQLEDFWPNGFDHDYNDTVIAYNYQIARNPAGEATLIRAVFEVLANGGYLELGMGLQLPVPSGAVGTVTRSVDGGPSTNLTPSSADGNLVVNLVDSIKTDIFGVAPATIVNSQGPTIANRSLEIIITLSTPTALDASLAPWDLYTFRTATPSHEIHLATYCGTAAMDTSLFGTSIDSSDLAGSRCFTDDRSIPAGLHIPQAGAYPQEETDIAALYPAIVQWAASGGVQNQDWYGTPVTANAFTGALTPSFPGGGDTLAVDSSCVPAGQSATQPGLTCWQLRQQVGITTDGSYWVDPDGAGGASPFQAYCDMTTDGGGWTLVDNDASTSTKFTSRQSGANSNYSITRGAYLPSYAWSSTPQLLCRASYYTGNLPWLTLNAVGSIAREYPTRTSVSGTSSGQWSSGKLNGNTNQGLTAWIYGANGRFGSVWIGRGSQPTCACNYHTGSGWTGLGGYVHGNGATCSTWVR